MSLGATSRRVHREKANGKAIVCTRDWRRDVNGGGMLDCSSSHAIAIRVEPAICDHSVANADAHPFPLGNRRTKSLGDPCGASNR